jgi:hypothetical protein
VAVGLGLLTKAYFVTTIPAFATLAVYSVRRQPTERRRIVTYALVGFALALLISFGWYWRNHELTGSWSGEENEVMAAHLTATQLLAKVPHVHWVGGVIAVLVSHVWFGAWSFLKLPKSMYVVFGGGMVAAFAGLAKVVRDRWLNPSRMEPPRAGYLLVAGTLYAFFWAGLFYDILVVYIGTGVSASNGWYMYAVVLPEMLLACCGLLAMTPHRWRNWALPGMALAFIVIDLYGVHALLVPYYTGLIAHVPGTDIVHPATLNQFLHFSPSLTLERLTTNKPTVFNPVVCALLFIVYWAATGGSVAVAYFAGTNTRSHPLREVAEKATVVG